MEVPAKEVHGKESHAKSLSLAQIILLNAVVCGVEVCACAGFTYIPPILLKAGYAEENMSIILGLGPLAGFFLVPIIGQASDHCRNRYGRRRPFILGLSAFLIVSLLLIPYCDLISFFLLGDSQFSKTLTIIILTVSVVLLDFTCQACLTPCEALLSDASKGTDQKERVFMVYSQMVSLGGFLGYLITALDWSNNWMGKFFGTQERTVFTLLIFVFIILLSATILVANEQPLASIVMNEEEVLPLANPALSSQQPNAVPGQLVSGTLESGYESSDSDPYDDEDDVLKVSRSRGLKKKKSFPSPFNLLLKPFKGITVIVFTFVSKMRLVVFLFNVCKMVILVFYNRLPDSIKKLFDIPLVLKNLALANFCSWTAVMAFNLFYTDFMGQWVYQGNPNAPENSFLRNRYDEGVRMGSWGLLLHCITSTSYAFFVEGLVEKYGTKKTYLYGMLSFTVAMFGMVINKNVILVNTMAAITGFAYATLTTIPFILITKYHSCKEVYFSDTIKSSKPLQPLVGTESDHERGVATDIGTLDSAYFLSQVVLSALMGYVVYLTGSVLSYMATACAMGFLSCVFIQRIISSKSEMRSHLRKQRPHTVVINL